MFLVRFQLVWRRLEFALFGALTPVGALFYFLEVFCYEKTISPAALLVFYDCDFFLL